ncbi:MAG: hypothetical protein INR63_12175 [Actinomycetospora chiangmaiensis]|nr:hypothetical protein [Actinomycetospora chiangmaiensis]
MPWAPIQVWATGLICVASAPATLVYVGGTAYVCAISHIAGTFAADLAAGKWAQVAPGGLQPWKTPPVAWAASTAYAAFAPADCVTYQGGCYVCFTGHTSGASFDASKWTQIAAPGQAAGALLTANALSELAGSRTALVNLGHAGSPVRQTVQSGPATSGVPSFLPGSSASLTLAFQNVSGSTPLILTCAKGFDAAGAVDVIALFTANPSLTLPASATSYLYYDLDAGAWGSTTLAPIYGEGGAPSTTNGQFTFDKSAGAMIGWLGNGSTAARANRVFVGEAVTSAGAVTSTVAYAYQGRFQSAPIAFTAGSTYVVPHNLGVGPEHSDLTLLAATANAGPWFPNAAALTGSYTAPAIQGNGNGRLGAFVTAGSNTSSGLTTGYNQNTTSGYFMVRARRAW